MADSSDIDAAVLAKLGSDTALLALMPNGVYWSEATEGQTRFVRVTMVSPHDEISFDGRAMEEVVYAVTAVAKSTVVGTTDMKSAAARIDELLDPRAHGLPEVFSVPGYTLVSMQRFADDPRIRETELDAVDPSIRWYHRGGRYRIVMST